MNEKILYVDDDPKILAAYQRNFLDRYEFDTAMNGREALKIVSEQGPYAILVADLKMPEMGGLELLQHMQKLAPDTVRIMLTGNADQDTTIRSVNQGQVFQFLTKPCSNEMLANALDSGLEKYRLVMAEHELLEKTLKGSIRVLIDILSILQPEAFGRAQRLRDYVKTFAHVCHIEQSWIIEIAALLSSIGATAVPPDVMERYNLDNALTAAEKEMIRDIPSLGARLLKKIPRMDEVAEFILYQDKLYDGSGYPKDSLAGEQIPQGARILKLLKDVMLQESTGVSRIKAVEILKGRPGWYDPALLEYLDEWTVFYLSEAPRQEIGLNELKPGTVILEDIKTEEGLTLVGAGYKISPIMLQRIRNFSQLTKVFEPVIIEGSADERAVSKDTEAIMI
ncbi:MAG: HD domain-containing phosphohydrolase [Verrucomicrobiota bacterium]